MSEIFIVTMFPHQFNAFVDEGRVIPVIENANVEWRAYAGTTLDPRVEQQIYDVTKFWDSGSSTLKEAGRLIAREIAKYDRQESFAGVMDGTEPTIRHMSEIPAPFTLTVNELIKKLQAFDPETLVVQAYDGMWKEVSICKPDVDEVVDFCEHIDFLANDDKVTKLNGGDFIYFFAG